MQAERDLIDPEKARRYYADRYAGQYMQDWPDQKLNRVAALVRQAALPPTGTFLDFGCGTGVFTKVLSTVLPGWNAIGTDITEKALEHAVKRCPSARFYSLPSLPNLDFDFIFSHHVLEHVHDIEDVMGWLAGALTPGGQMLHVLPCGNQGSLEHDICSIRTEGIDFDVEGRFFFEEEGHLRRLTSAKLTEVAGQFGFRLGSARFANHYYGALLWMSEQSREWIDRTLNPAMGRTDRERRWLSQLRRRIQTLRVLRRPPSLLKPGMEWRLSKRNRSLVEMTVLIAGNPLTMFSSLANRWIMAKDDQEWQERQDDERGSEMYLWFGRDVHHSGGVR